VAGDVDADVAGGRAFECVGIGGGVEVGVDFGVGSGVDTLVASVPFDDEQADATVSAAMSATVAPKSGEVRRIRGGRGGVT
jgi:hypothetical protein